MSNRKQRVVLNGKTSSWKSVNAGVPQGSVLGPLMFLIYINDISLNLSCKTTLFADDTSLSKQIMNRQVCELEIQNLKTIETWAEKWKVTFNPQNSDALLVSRKIYRNNNTNFLFQCHDIKNVKEHCHLGLIWNNVGTWKTHLLLKHNQQSS